MYTINIKGKPNPKDPTMVKLEMIFFKSNYPRVTKVVNVTGLLADWDAKSQSFRVGSAEATAKNKILFDLKTKYYHKADDWEIEGHNWSPVQLSHAFDEVEQIKSEVVIKSVFQMVESFEERYLEKKRIKNGHIMDSIKTAKCYTNLKKTLIQFTSEKYNKSFSSSFLHNNCTNCIYLCTNCSRYSLGENPTCCLKYLRKVNCSGKFSCSAICLIFIEPFSSINLA